MRSHGNEQRFARPPPDRRARRDSGDNDLTATLRTIATDLDQEIDRLRELRARVLKLASSATPYDPTEAWRGELQRQGLLDEAATLPAGERAAAALLDTLRMIRLAAGLDRARSSLAAANGAARVLAARHELPGLAPLGDRSRDPARHPVRARRPGHADPRARPRVARPRGHGRNRAGTRNRRGSCRPHPRRPDEACPAPCGQVGFQTSVRRRSSAIAWTRTSCSSGLSSVSIACASQPSRRRRSSVSVARPLSVRSIRI